MQASEDILKRARRIRLVVMDVDGVLTDGAIILSDVSESRNFSVRDGMGISVARHAGLRFAVITGGRSAAVERRAADMKIDIVELQCTGKRTALEAMCAAEGLDISASAFIGDDWIDLPAMQVCGLSVAPANAPYDIRREAHIVTSATGGHGAVREFLEWLLDAQGGWAAAATRWVEANELGQATLEQ
jgi:3-deoxy-D-manno-octulosonate 8-phosphate phosphatase (KDO 8-P phosphatase)